MKTRPIPFTAEMVKAILDGRKTQTRRVIKSQPWRIGHGEWAYIKSERSIYAADQWMSEGGMRSQLHHLCPYGAAGDRLWIQEGYQITAAPTGTRHVWGRYLLDAASDPSFDVELSPAEYTKWERRKWPFRVTPGRFMYRSLSRITLDIVSVRVERVQDITKEDILAEGLPDRWQQASNICHLNSWTRLWNSINTKRGYSWDVNPWVWVIEFQKLVPKTLDAPLGEE